MFERYYQELINYISHATGDRDAASDIVQETYARALTAQQGWRQSLTTSDAVIKDASKKSISEPKVSETKVSEPRAFLFRIAKNISTDRYRHLKIRQHEDVDELEIMAPESTAPDAMLSNSRLTHALLTTIDQLPARCKEAFVLFKFEHLSHAEIASKMGISRNMVEKHILRGMVACKQCLDASNQV